MTFQSLPGVKGTRVGYTGGTAPEPTYNTVCRGDGHTEAIKIDYDPNEISYDKLVDVFFSEHMPTRKGKTQYKSAVWVHDKEQEKVIQTKIKEVEANLGLKIATDVEAATEWFDAEEYHQNYIQKQSGGRKSWFSG